MPGGIPLGSDLEQGRNLFVNETFDGNGRTCATCHVLSLNGGMPPSNVAARFATLATTFDPLFIAEASMNLNTLTIGGGVTFSPGAILTGTASGGAPVKAKVLTASSATEYLVYGGVSPAFAPATTVTDGARTASVVRIDAGNLNQLESPALMRGPSTSSDFPQGRALILENIDGFGSPPVFRKSPHMQNLAHSRPFGFNDQIGFLEEFTVGAVQQHFSRRIERQEGRDLRLPTAEEQRLMTAFLESLDSVPGADVSKFNLGHFARTTAQKRGLASFQGNGKCTLCHFGPGAGQRGRPPPRYQRLEPADQRARAHRRRPPLRAAGLPFGSSSRKIATLSLFNVKNNAPFFHDNSAATLEKVLEFYQSPLFANSPDGTTISLGAGESQDLIAFLSSLVARPYSVQLGGVDVTREGSSVDFGVVLLSGGVATRALTVVNTNPTGGASDHVPRHGLQITGLAGQTPGEFPAPDCSALSGATLAPGQSKTITVRFDPATMATKSAILEVLAPNPTGVDLLGVGNTALAVNEAFATASTTAPTGWTVLRGGSFSVSGGQLRLASCSGTACVAPNGNLLVREFVLPPSYTVTVRAVATATSSAVNDFSVIFGLQDASNYYYASFNEKDTLSDGSDDPNTNGIFCVQGGQRSQLADFPSVTAPGDGTAALHTVRIERIAARSGSSATARSLAQRSRGPSRAVRRAWAASTTAPASTTSW